MNRRSVVTTGIVFFSFVNARFRFEWRDVLVNVPSGILRRAFSWKRRLYDR